jgi:hypothetical protein
VDSVATIDKRSSQHKCFRGLHDLEGSESYTLKFMGCLKGPVPPSLTEVEHCLKLHHVAGAA